MEDEEIGLIKRVFIYGAVLAAATAMIGGIWGLFRPAQLDLERQAQEHSPQYVEARRMEILNEVASVRQIDVDLARADMSASAASALRLQREAICEQVRQALAEIPSDAAPVGAEVCR